MAAGIGSMNVYYQRYSDTAGIITSPQPGVTTSEYIDAGFGWSRFRYFDFNQQYRRILDNGSVGVVSAYVRHTQDNQIGIVSSYVRHDAANVGYVTAGNDIPNVEP